jgi:hypothetical protein
MREFTAPALAPGGAMIHVLYPANLTGSGVTRTLTAIRTDLGIQQAFLKTTPAALVIRGSAAQIAQADELVQNADRAAKP